MTTARANLIILNKYADLLFVGQHVVAPLGHYAAKDLGSALESLGAESIEVEFHTVPEQKGRDRDVRKYTKRLAALSPRYVRGPWSNKVVDGYVFADVLRCQLDRVGP